MPVQPGDYGPVLILAGPYEGRVGYYDDDDSDSDDDAAPDDAGGMLGDAASFGSPHQFRTSGERCNTCGGLQRSA